MKLKKALKILLVLIGIQASALILVGTLAYRVKPELLLIFSAAAFLFLVADLILWATINKNVQTVYLEMELQQAKEQKILEEQYKERQMLWEREAEEMRMLLHQKLSTIMQLMGSMCTNEEKEKENETQVRVLLKDIGESLEKNREAHFCSHLLSNIILSEKSSMAQNMGIEVKISAAVPENLPLSDSEWCSLWCNLLDNAIEACERMREGKLWISVKAAVIDGYFYIKAENSSGFNPDVKGTLKPDKENHGFGLIILRDLAKKYGGNFINKQEAASYQVIFTMAARMGGD